ncbi:MAG: glycosyl hydrolase family 18 protein [bacterium]|nr:glycosyl hydrolase family 18 protein [bacterium]
MIKNYLKTFILLSLITLVPQNNLFASELKISGWIPYWRVTAGVADAKTNLNDIDTLHPFVYTVQEDGSIKDLGNLSDKTWTKLFKSARSKKVEVIPTIMWSDGGKMQEILSVEELRKNHVANIVSLVKQKKFDGIDIDYEAKRSETKDFYSLFLKELKKGLKGKILTCTVEARTPLDSLYTVVPSVIEYANDYVEIGKYCDRVEIMGYDLGRADVKLNASNKGMPYVPVADTDWVKKVVELTIKDGIPAEKIMLAIPTYGYEYVVTAAPEQYRGYQRQHALNPGYGVTTAKENNVIPSRDNGGELSFSYFATSSPFSILSSLPVPEGTTTGNKAAAQALLFSTATGMEVPFNYIVWSDAEAIRQKVELAKSMNLRGIAIFKIDGGEDKNMWETFR